MCSASEAQFPFTDTEPYYLSVSCHAVVAAHIEEQKDLQYDVQPRTGALGRGKKGRLPTDVSSGRNFPCNQSINQSIKCLSPSLRCWLKDRKISALSFYVLRGAPHWTLHPHSEPIETDNSCLFASSRNSAFLKNDYPDYLLAWTNVVPTRSLMFIVIAFWDLIPFCLSICPVKHNLCWQSCFNSLH